MCILNGIELQVRKILGLSLLVPALSGCSLILDVDRFQPTEEEEPVNENFAALHLRMIGMDSHVSAEHKGCDVCVDERFEYRVVDSNNRIASRGVLSRLAGTEDSIYMPSAVPKLNSPNRLDFFVDHDPNHDNEYTPRDPVLGFLDHSWRIGLDPNQFGAGYKIDFPHSQSWVDLNQPAMIEQGGDVVIKFSGMKDYRGKRLEVRIANVATGHVLALYRLAEIPSIQPNRFEIKVPKMVEAGVSYRIKVYIGEVMGTWREHWMLEKYADAEGLNAEFNP